MFHFFLSSVKLSVSLNSKLNSTYFKDKNVYICTSHAVLFISSDTNELVC